MDGTPAAQRTVALAEALAVRRGTSVLLAGLAPCDPAPDLESLHAQLTLDEYGVGQPLLWLALDDEACLTRALQALLPARRRLAAAGVPVAIRMLRSADPATELRALLARGRGLLVLTNPLDLGGALRTLTNDLLVQPPCSLYVAGLERSARRSWWHPLTELLRHVWHPSV
ncbi:MAG TPA: hypothetical protein VFD32_22060 [Dehalococcoidia bacterium]|nr:hypothetical protein [Dehalococcoidia bacterium]